MKNVALTITALTMALTILLLVLTLLPVFNKQIKITQSKKTKIWFAVIIIIVILEILSIVVSIIGEVTYYITPAPSYIWAIFKLFSLIFLWVWSYFYFFIWIKFKKTKSTKSK